MANEVIIKDSNRAFEDADELVKNCKRMNETFTELADKLKQYTTSTIRLDWMDEVEKRYQQYNEQEIKDTLKNIEFAAENIKNYVVESIKYSHEER